MQGEIPAADDAALLNDVLASRESTGTPAPVEDKRPEQPRAPDGKFAPKPKEEPQPAAAQAGAQPPAAPSSEPVDPDATRHVPLSELKSERAKRQEKERLYIEAEARAKAYEEQVRLLLQQQQRLAPQRQPEPQPAPDPIADPEGALQHLYRTMRQETLHRQANLSYRLNLKAYGKDELDKAIQAAPVDLCNHLFETSADPWGDLMDWWKEQQVKREVGTDLEAFKKRIEEEVRQKVLAELKAGGAPQQPQRFPGTLAAATNAAGAGSAPVAQSDDALINSVLEANRRRR
jgi:hypothetical protein